MNGGCGSKGGREYANVVTTATAEQDDVSGAAATDAKQTIIPELSLDHVQRLLSLIDAPKGGYEKLSGKISWMLNSGASSHMTSNEKLLSMSKNIQPLTIRLPNGALTLASTQGKINLQEKILLNKVLYVPEFDCNLVFVAKLCKDMNCTMTFFDDFFVL